MEHKEKLSRVKNMIAEWNRFRQVHDKAYSLLNSGAYFFINRENVLRWSSANPDLIHAYFGVEDDKLFFILLDDKTGSIRLDDMNNEQLSNIVISEFNDDLPLSDFDFINEVSDGENVSVVEALSRSLRWNMMKESWVKYQINNNENGNEGIGRVFSFPYSDFKTLLQNNNVDNIAAVLGLKIGDPKAEYSQSYNLDLSFWAILNKNKAVFRSRSSINVLSAELPVEDLSNLCPPWCGESEYCLL